MKTIGVKLNKWQQPIMDQAIVDSLKFIKDKYNVDVSDLATLKYSNTCRFAYYQHNKGIIRIDLKRTFVKLYSRKTLGEYETQLDSLGYKISWTCQLIHEFTHLIQDIDNRCFSEVETTQNEIEYLGSIGIKVKY